MSRDRLDSDDFVLAVPMGASIPVSELSGRGRYSAGMAVAGKYVLARRLGRGSQGSLWVAQNAVLDSLVVLKIIDLDIDDPGTKERVLREARTAASIGHSAIVQVYDMGETERGDPFIAMELLDGEDLAGILHRKGRIRPDKALQAILPIAHALAAMHQRGVVHRDLKPGNVFLATSETGPVQPKLVDFGIVKLDTPEFGATGTERVAGSPAYMSPEQIRGLDVDHRADIWGLSMVLYEAITGVSPFKGENIFVFARSVLDDPAIPITERNVGDEALWRILARGLEKDPEDRWPSVREMGTALARWLVCRGVTEDITGSALRVAWLEWTPDQRSVDQLFTTIPPPRMGGDDANGKAPAPVNAAKKEHSNAQAPRPARQSDGKRDAISQVKKKPPSRG